MNRPSARLVWLRRVLAVGALVAVAAVAWILLAGDESGPGADEGGAEVEEVTIESEAVGETLPVSVVTPEGAQENEPLLVFLHGKGADEESLLVDPMFSALADLGERAPVVAGATSQHQAVVGQVRSCRGSRWAGSSGVGGDGGHALVSPGLDRVEQDELGDGDVVEQGLQASPRAHSGCEEGQQGVGELRGLAGPTGGCRACLGSSRTCIVHHAASLVCCLVVAPRWGSVCGSR